MRESGTNATIMDTVSEPSRCEKTTPSPVPLRLAAMLCAVIFAVISPRLLPPCSEKLPKRKVIATIELE